MQKAKIGKILKIVIKSNRSKDSILIYWFLRILCFRKPWKAFCEFISCFNNLLSKLALGSDAANLFTNLGASSVGHAGAFSNNTSSSVPLTTTTPAGNSQWKSKNATASVTIYFQTSNSSLNSGGAFFAQKSCFRKDSILIQIAEGSIPIGTSTIKAKIFYTPLKSLLSEFTKEYC
ncbi:hypothetical protein HK096_005084 [Nowakowskiella sp. JEL0078]|nr:hypothetical protein HK096_005084 [Nowakowskiella sp. JEL0078]